MNSRLQTLREIEDELNIRLDGSRPKQMAGSSRSSWEVRGKPGGVHGQLYRLGRRGPGGHGSSGDPGSPGQQRVVVKASYTVHQSKGRAAGNSGRSVLRAHTTYLSRDSASLDGEPGRFYDRENEQISAKDAFQIVQAWENDRHHFRFIVSPEYADQIEHHPGSSGQPGGLTGYVRELVAQMEKDLGITSGGLEWLAINHYNTDDLHTHLLVRGKTFRGRVNFREEGKDLVIPREYIRSGMRQTAQVIATRWLGERTAEQVNAAHQQEVQAERFTSLDGVIEYHLDRSADPPQLRLRGEGALADDALRRRVASRLQHLEGMGLAARDRHGRWAVDAELKPKLQSLAFRSDIIKNLYARLGPRSAFVSRYDGNELIGRVVHTGVHDELRDRRYLAVESVDKTLVYVLPTNSEALRPLEEGGLVRITGADQRRGKTDVRIAEVARNNGGLYTSAAHRRQLPEHFAASDVEGFLRSHERRLGTLEQSGAATRQGEGWAIRDIAALERGDHAHARRDTGTVEVISARAVASQAEADAWTWLDRQLYLRSLGKPTAVPFDRGLEQAAEARQRWMVERGYAEWKDNRYTVKPGATKTLRDREWRAVKPGLRQRFGASVQKLAAGSESDGSYRGTVALNTGMYAVVAGRLRVHLVPVRTPPPLSIGTPVRAKVNAQGKGILVAANGRGRPHEREGGAER